MRICFVFLLLAAMLCAEESGCINGILCLGSWVHVRKEPVDLVEGVHVRGVALLERHPKFLQSLADQYLTKPLGKEQIRCLQEEIALFYEQKNQPAVSVCIPKQDLAQGVLQVVVIEPKLGQVRTQGNCYFPGRLLREAVSTRPGEPIVTECLLADLAWLNLSPFRRTDAVFVPGERPGVTDIELISVDYWPYRVYAGADNTGTVATDRNRLFFGLNFGKTLLPDGQISYQFSCSPNWNLFYTHTASAKLPLPWRHFLVFGGGYARVEPKIAQTRALSDYSWQVNGRYRIPVTLSAEVLQEVVIGYDFKEVHNHFQVETDPPFLATADISQGMVGYEIGHRDLRQKLSLVLEMYGNPGGVTAANHTSNYKKFRAHAKSRYIYGKVSHSYTRKLGSCSFSYDLSAQYASANLLPSEQMTMTGYEGVRGYEERVLNLDSGAIVHLSLETPHWNLLKRFSRCRARDMFYFLGFFDYGLGANHQEASGVKNFRDLASAGPGVRYQIDRFLTARFDYGVQLWHRGFSNPSNSRYNFGLIVSF